MEQNFNLDPETGVPVRFQDPTFVNKAFSTTADAVSSVPGAVIDNPVTTIGILGGGYSLGKKPLIDPLVKGLKTGTAQQNLKNIIGSKYVKPSDFKNFVPAQSMNMNPGQARSFMDPKALFSRTKQLPGQIFRQAGQQIKANPFAAGGQALSSASIVAPLAYSAYVTVKDEADRTTANIENLYGEQEQIQQDALPKAVSSLQRLNQYEMDLAEIEGREPVEITGLDQASQYIDSLENFEGIGNYQAGDLQKERAFEVPQEETDAIPTEEAQNLTIPKEGAVDAPSKIEEFQARKPDVFDEPTYTDDQGNQFDALGNLMTDLESPSMEEFLRDAAPLPASNVEMTNQLPTGQVQLPTQTRTMDARPSDLPTQIRTMDVRPPSEEELRLQNITNPGNRRLDRGGTLSGGLDLGGTFRGGRDFGGTSTQELGYGGLPKSDFNVAKPVGNRRFDSSGLELPSKNDIRRALKAKYPNASRRQISGLAELEMYNTQQNQIKNDRDFAFNVEKFRANYNLDADKLAESRRQFDQESQRKDFQFESEFQLDLAEHNALNNYRQGTLDIDSAKLALSAEDLKLKRELSDVGTRNYIMNNGNSVLQKLYSGQSLNPDELNVLRRYDYMMREARTGMGDGIDIFEGMGLDAKQKYELYRTGSLTQASQTDSKSKETDAAQFVRMNSRSLPRPITDDKKLKPNQAQIILDAAGGNKSLAREAAEELGFIF